MPQDSIDPEKWIHETDPVEFHRKQQAEIERYWAGQSARLDGKQSYADWLLERTRHGLATDIDPPDTVESREAWRAWIIGQPSEAAPGTATLEAPLRFRASTDRADRARQMRLHLRRLPELDRK
jgi:hypothetical protein